MPTALPPPAAGTVARGSASYDNGRMCDRKRHVDRRRAPISRRASLLGAGLAALAACTSPAGPDPFGDPPPGTHQSALVAVIGGGGGGTSVTSEPHPGAFFAGIMRFRVRARPNTTYLVQRAADLGRAAADDGVCQRADGVAPWSPSDPPFGTPFVTFPRPFEGALVVLTTDARGEGSLDYPFQTPQIPRGTRFDVRMRLVDDESSPNSDLRSGCMTIVVN
jgi:hypothetical protein